MAGQPTKLTDKFLNVAQKVINSDIDAIIFTDLELLEDINDKLEESERISIATFKVWKGKPEYSAIYKKAQKKQKRNLINQLRKEEKSWQRYAWILERKFPEFNLKQLSETVHKVEPITINLNLNKNG